MDRRMAGRIMSCWTAAAGKSWSAGATRSWCGRTPRPSGSRTGKTAAGARPTPEPPLQHRRRPRDKNKLPESWPISYKSLPVPGEAHELSSTQGLFPEQAANWDFAMEQIRQAGRPIRC